MSPCRAESQFHTAPWLSWIKAPLIFRVTCFEGFSLCGWSQSFECMMWCTDNLLYRKKFLCHCLFVCWRSRLNMGCCVSGKVLGNWFSFQSWCSPFTLWCGVANQTGLWLFSEEIVPYVVLDLLCTWEDVTPGSSCTAILNFPFHKVFINQAIKRISVSPYLTLHTTHHLCHADN